MESVFNNVLSFFGTASTVKVNHCREGTTDYLLGRVNDPLESLFSGLLCSY